MPQDTDIDVTDGGIGVEPAPIVSETTSTPSLIAWRALLARTPAATAGDTSRAARVAAEVMADIERIRARFSDAMLRARPGSVERRLHDELYTAERSALACQRTAVGALTAQLRDDPDEMRVVSAEVYEHLRAAAEGLVRALSVSDELEEGTPLLPPPVPRIEPPPVPVEDSTVEAPRRRPEPETGPPPVPPTPYSLRSTTWSGEIRPADSVLPAPPVADAVDELRSGPTVMSPRRRRTRSRTAFLIRLWFLVLVIAVGIVLLFSGASVLS